MLVPIVMGSKADLAYGEAFVPGAQPVADRIRASLVN